MEFGTHHPSGTWMHAPAQELSKPLHLEFQWSFHYLGVID